MKIQTQVNDSEVLPHEGGRASNVSHAGPGSDSNESADISGPEVGAVLEPEQTEQPELFTAKPVEPEVVDNNQPPVDKESEEIDKEEMAALIAPNLSGWIPAKNLHKFLLVKSDYNHWIKRRIEGYEFRLDIDYLQSEVTGLPAFVSIDTAKQLSMIEKGPRGRAARRYYIECERVAKVEKHVTIKTQPIDHTCRSSCWVGSKIL